MAKRKAITPGYWATVWVDEDMVRELDEMELNDVHNMRQALLKAAALTDPIDGVVEVRVRRVMRR